METQEMKVAKKIVREHLRFMRTASDQIEEAKRATVLSLQKVLKLEAGDAVLIKEDGSFEIETRKQREKAMSEKVNENKKERNEKLTLNGREVTAEELQRQREAVQNQKGARLEEVTKGNFRLRLKG